MEEFLGILFCGGKGERLGELTRYISKSFIPVFDKPVFKFGLEQLEKSELVNEIIILTNRYNDKLLSGEGYKTIVQDDNIVNDMFSGWNYVKEITGTKKHGVLIPSDNIRETEIDFLIGKFIESGSEFLFSLKNINDANKLSQMGTFDTAYNKYSYKKAVSSMGVIAPYIISNKTDLKRRFNIFESDNSEYLIYEGIWFDLGDFESIVNACKWRQKTIADKF